LRPERSFFTLENTLYLGLFALALGLRLLNLGASPLNDPEAREALTALRFLRGQPDLALPHSPAYLFFTYLGFLTLGATDATARLAPALFGAGVVILPWLFRDVLGRPQALVTAALLAISSSLLAASRSADGSVIAVFALALGLGLLRQYTQGGPSAWLMAGAAAWGVGLASGAAFLSGALILVVAGRILTLRDAEAGQTVSDAIARLWAERLAFLLTFASSALVVATVALLYRTGFGALADVMTMWLSGFVPGLASGRALSEALTFWVAYDPLIFVFGGVGLWHAFRSPERGAKSLAWFALIALVFILLYSGRTMFDLLWVAAPLAALGASALVALIRESDAANTWGLALVQSAIFVALLAYAMINLTAFAEQARLNGAFLQGGLSPEAPGVSNLTLAGLALLVSGLVAYLFSAGWSPSATQLAVSVTGAGALAIATLSAGWGWAQVRSNDPVEMWWTRPAAMDLKRLVQTLESVSNFNVGQENEIVVTVEAWQDLQNPRSPEDALKEAQSGALAWALRDFPNAQFVGQLDALIDSPVVITPAQEQNPTLGSAYVGQAFPLYRFWFPENLFWYEQINWLAFRNAPAQTANVILWVRQDVARLQSPAAP
jgi:hypothetical protein